MLLESSCAQPIAIVDLQWIFVDGATPVDPCHVQAFEPETGAELSLRVRPRLRIFSCPDQQEATACNQGEAIAAKTFRCDETRGSLTEVPGSDEAYLIDVDLVVEAENRPNTVLNDRCIARPGPRWRQIGGGNLVDLNVYEFVVNRALFRTDFSKCMDTAEPVVGFAPAIPRG
jgi:hypothetical protein